MTRIDVSRDNAAARVTISNSVRKNVHSTEACATLRELAHEGVAGAGYGEIESIRASHERDLLVCREHDSVDPAQHQPHWRDLSAGEMTMKSKLSGAVPFEVNDNASHDIHGTPW